MNHILFWWHYPTGAMYITERRDLEAPGGLTMQIALTLRRMIKTLFSRLRNDTYANSFRVAGTGRQRAYCQTFRVPHLIESANKRSIAGIGGARKPVDLIVRQVSLKDLDVVINVAFLVLQEHYLLFYPLQICCQTG